MAYLRLMLMVAMLGSSGAAGAQDALLKVRFATDWKAQAEQGGFIRPKPWVCMKRPGLMSRYAAAARALTSRNYWAPARLSLAWGRIASFRSIL